MLGPMKGGLEKLFAQQLQKFQKLQEELAAARVEASAGGGMVTAVANGNGELQELRISREAVDPEDVEMLQDLVLAAVREALEKARALQQEKATALTGGLKLPGLGF